MAKSPSRSALRRLHGKLMFTTIGTAAAPAIAAASVADTDEVEAALDLIGADDPDAAHSGHAFAILLERMHPLSATRAAATAAMSPRPEMRIAVGEALTWAFTLVGDDVVIDHLSRDPIPEVRFAAARAAHARRASGGDPGVLERLVEDPDPAVRQAAVLALHGR